MKIPGLGSDVEALAALRQDPWLFMSTCVYTIDQVDRWNPIKRYPAEKEYLKYLVHEIVNEPYLALVKHRRLRATWTLCGVYLWDAMFYEGRFNALVSKKEEDSDELVRRCLFIYDNIPKEVLRVKPVKEYKYTEMRFPEIDSKIKGVAAGADQLRQYTCSRIGCDEFAYWPQAEETFVAMRPTIEGGGKVCLVSTRWPGFFQRIVEDAIDDAAAYVASSPAEEKSRNSPIVVAPPREKLMEGMSAWRNPKNGFRVIDLEYTADPDKRSPEWAATTKAGMPSTKWEREYGNKWTVYPGKPVYSDYKEPTHLVVGNIVAPPRSKLVSGWDGGPNDLNLAWALGLVFVDAPAVVIIDEFHVDDGDTEGFVQIVGSRLQLEWFKLGGFCLHVADQSVFTPGGVQKSSMADAMRKHGMAPVPAEISFAKRRVCVEDLITKIYSDKQGGLVPRFRVHERCTMTREALLGGYAYPKANAGVGGEYKPLPLKNKFSHIANAIEYLCSRLHIAGTTVPYEGRRLPRVSVI